MVKFALVVVAVLALCVGWGEAAPKPSKAPTMPKPTKEPTPAASKGVDGNGKPWIVKRECGGYNKTSTEADKEN
jgi:hypothetical protein